jgi:hypothetical protein
MDLVSLLGADLVEAVEEDEAIAGFQLALEPETEIRHIAKPVLEAPLSRCRRSGPTAWAWPSLPFR